MNDYSDKVRFVVKMYPYRYRHFARMAAEAALAAGDQGKFWEMHEKLLAESPKLDRESLLKYAQDLGLDMKKFTHALDTMKHEALIDRDLKLAEKLDLYNTPTFFFNGREVIGNRPYENLKEILLEELNAADK